MFELPSRMKNRRPVEFSNVTSSLHCSTARSHVGSLRGKWKPTSFRCLALRMKSVPPIVTVAPAAGWKVTSPPRSPAMSWDGYVPSATSTTAPAAARLKAALNVWHGDAAVVQVLPGSLLPLGATKRLVANGVMVSIVHVEVAAVPVVPAVLVALTRKVCEPSATPV